MANNILRFWQSLDSDDPFAPLFKGAPLLMHSIDANGVLLSVSDFWASKLGYTVDEMVGRKSTDFLTDDSRQHAKDKVLPEFFRTGKVFNVEYDFVRRDGKIMPVLMSGIAEYGSTGEFVRSLAIMFDNTEAKRAAAELRQKQRMEAIGSLVGGVAHDFNNLLAVVQGNLEFLLSDPDDCDRIDFIESALRAARRGGTLTQQLLSYGRQAHLTPRAVDINEVVKSADRMIRRLLPANILFQAVTGAGSWKVEVDTAQLETAILNIVNNANDALSNGGKITIETANVRITEDYIATRGEEIEPGRYVMLAISDTGHGMDAATAARAFDPFFTTKPVGKGSGLGLSMVYGFMRQSNGAIRTYSEPGVGTTFKLYFPANSETKEPVYLRQNEEEPEGDGKTILLAEDEDEVRRVLARQLTNAKYTVIKCQTGDEACLRVEGGLRPDILLTDIVMPGSLQGPELASRLRELCPGIKVLFISGYPTEAAIHGNGIRLEDRHLIKPVNRSDLIRTLGELTSDKQKRSRG